MNQYEIDYYRKMHAGWMWAHVVAIPVILGAGWWYALPLLPIGLLGVVVAAGFMVRTG